MELAQVIIAMASHDYLSLEGGETLIEFIVKHAGITDEEIARFHKEKVSYLYIYMQSPSMQTHPSRYLTAAFKYLISKTFPQHNVER